jgi:uncharacterized membrane-anchored protein
MLNKVPEITAYFWIIKVLCTTVGETFADYVNVDIGLGTNNTLYVGAAALAAALAVQLATRRYMPAIYWVAVVVISIFGTLITDKLTDGYDVPLEITTITFAIILSAVFLVWYQIEHTLSIHSIFTLRREGFYWLAILFTFALGTAAGDLVAERFDLGYLNSLILFLGIITIIAIAHFGLDLHHVRRVLGGVRDDSSPRSVNRRLHVTGHGRWRPRTRHSGHELALPRRDTRAGRVSNRDESRRA